MHTALIIAACVVGGLAVVWLLFMLFLLFLLHAFFGWWNK